MTRSRRRFQVIATQSFAAALERLEPGGTSNQSNALKALRSTLRQRVIPLLERHPGVGRPFRSWGSLSAEGRQIVERIQRRLRAREVREYVTPEHLVLYVVGERTVHLLSVRNQRELAFPEPTRPTAQPKARPHPRKRSTRKTAAERSRR